MELCLCFSVCLHCIDRDSFAITLVLYTALILSLQAPSLSWNDVIIELDYAEFMVKDRQGLTLLFTALRLGLQNQGFHPEMFPVDLLYRHWKNAEGQVS